MLQLFRRGAYALSAARLSSPPALPRPLRPQSVIELRTAQRTSRRFFSAELLLFSADVLSNTRVTFPHVELGFPRDEMLFPPDETLFPGDEILFLGMKILFSRIRFSFPGTHSAFLAATFLLPGTAGGVSEILCVRPLYG